VASDAHDCVNRTPDLSEAHEQVSSVWGKARAQRLFVDSPAAVISNAPIDRGRGRKRKSALFSLGAK
jgi:tyrosine-protein phosphatase YwqE